MKKRKFLYLPLDERPCNYSFAAQIAEGSPIELIRPSPDIMGRKKSPADFEGIKRFLIENAGGADAAIISVDALLYGGIVPSRLHCLSIEELETRLLVLDEVKAVNPQIKIYAFALIMRCPSYSSGDEEPDYYEHCGKEIFLTGQVKHRLQLNLIDKSEAEEALENYSRKTGAHLADFEARREINLSMLVKVAQMAGSQIDFLVIPQDDSSEFGYTTADREKLKGIIAQRGIKRISMYPGADEVGMTLLARAACECENRVPRIQTVFAADGAKDMIPLYEDRPLSQTLDCQIEAAGCQQSGEGDIVLFMNYPAHSPVHAGEAPTAGYAERNLEAFTGEIASAAEAGKLVAVADGAYCNGGDEQFVTLLAEKISLFKLSSYAGWNTSSNTLGTAICAAVFNLLYNSVPARFIAERLYDDLVYQAHTRSYLCNTVFPDTQYTYFDAKESDGEVAALVKRETQEYMQRILPQVAARFSINNCTMVWKRMFEAGFELSENKIPFAHGRRGVWHRPNDTGTETDLDGMIEVLQTFRRAGINTVFLESFYHGTAVYRSKLVPYNKKLEGLTYGHYPDYLTAFLAEAEKLGIEVHAWVEDFYIGLEENYFTENRRDWLLITKDGSIRQTEGNGFIFLDPANTEVRNFLIGVYTELLGKFGGIKGLNLDYIRYPFVENGDDTGYTRAAIEEFAGRDMTRTEFIEFLNANSLDGKWVDFRADKITSFVGEVRKRVKEQFPEAVLSTAVFPERTLSYQSKKQDFSRWLKEGLLDLVTPMAYYDDIVRLDEALSEMTGFCGNTRCLAGLSCTYHSLPVTDVFAQFASAERAGTDGFVLFGSRSVLESRKYVAALECVYG